MNLPPLLLVGGGRMGAAMLSGWREQGLAEIVVVDPAPAAALEGANTKIVTGAGAIPPAFQPTAVVFAIKPQSAAGAIPAYARFGNAVFISIMAGIPIARLSALLATPTSIIRAMPNTPAAIRRGFTVATGCPNVTAAQRALANTLLAATGEVAWVEDEFLLDPVTAISGGGPAYLFLLTELMEQAALDHGIPPDLARAMARKTIIGAAALLAAGDEDAAALRTAVTSPGGTTERALAVLRARTAWPETFAAAIDAATKRSRDLGIQ